MFNLETILAKANDSQPAALKRLFELLRIESVSTDSAYAVECVNAADWLVAQLNDIGFTASRRDTDGHPMVVAHSGGDGRHMLFYGHYDVQPVDPLDIWDRPPFDPVIEDTPKGKVIRARGASDDKGQLMTFVEACRAWKDVTGELPGNISILFEGEEESSSPSLVPFLTEHADELKADFALVCDTGLWDSDTPAITTMLRGLVAEDFTIHAANRDLHSGKYGGPAINPIRVLTKILGGLHDDQGRVTLPDFYEGVPRISNSLKAKWDALNFDTEGFLGDVGLTTPAGEDGYTAMEQIWCRPTCDINGINGGYTGEGFKTVLPADAHAKVSFRLVGTQDPDAISEAFRKYIRDNLPPDCEVTFRAKDGAAATNLPVDAPEFALAHKALSDEWPNDAMFIGMGGSIPIVGHFQEILGMDSVLIGFGQENDQIHSPNEKYDVRSFEKGTRSWIRVLHALQS